MSREVLANQVTKITKLIFCLLYAKPENNVEFKLLSPYMEEQLVIDFFFFFFLPVVTSCSLLI